MGLSDAVREILKRAPEGLTPQQIRDRIKVEFPDLYGTESHRRNVEKGHYKDLDHALLAQIYVASRTARDVYSDKSKKPMTLSLLADDSGGEEDGGDELETEDLSKLEVGIGTVYVLGTNLYTTEGREIVKVGITTGAVEKRIRQLYTTSVPFKFRLVKQYETRNYAELEQSLHRLLEPYRINRAREFFTEDCVEFIDRVVEIHEDIQRAAQKCGHGETREQTENGAETGQVG